MNDFLDFHQSSFWLFRQNKKTSVIFSRYNTMKKTFAYVTVLKRRGNEWQKFCLSDRWKQCDGFMT